MRRVAEGVAAGFGATAELDFRVIFAPLINDLAHTDELADAAASVVGEAHVDRAKPPGMGSEDFSFMMEKVPGAYMQVGNGDSAQLHNPAYNFNDEATPYGAALLAAVTERRLTKAGPGAAPCRAGLGSTGAARRHAGRWAMPGAG
jgi:metal-dependent amidase/aminoacylase/carboxypeptidase family protein